MKLKRILSLALSGVLAVSMLTACSGSSIINKFIDNRTFTVRDALNDAQDMVDYECRDTKLDSTVSQIAATLTPNQVTNGVADTSVGTAVRQLTGYGDLSLTRWQAQTTVGKETFVKIFVYNVDDEAFDSASEVAKDVAAKLEVLDLKSEFATEGLNVTNSYKGNVVAYEKTIGEGDSAFDAWIVGVSITQTVTAN